MSPAVLTAIARALQLDEAERAHLIDLARAAGGSSALMRPRRRTGRQWSVRPSLQWTLDAITQGPAFVRNGRMDASDGAPTTSGSTAPAPRTSASTSSAA